MIIVTNNSVNLLFLGKIIGYFLSYSMGVFSSITLHLMIFFHLTASLDLFLTVYNWEFSEHLIV